MQTPLLLLLVLTLRKLRNKEIWCVFQINSASCTSIDSKLLRSNALVFLKKRSKTLMRKACCLFKSLSLPTLRACPLYRLRISHLVIPLITLWAFISSVWPHDLDILPNSLGNHLVPIWWSILWWMSIPAPLLLRPFWRLLWILNLLINLPGNDQEYVMWDRQPQYTNSIQS